MENKKIIENKEVLEKVNFRLKFNIVVAILMFCFFVVSFVTKSIDEIYHASNNLNVAREQGDIIYSIIKIILYLILFICCLVFIKNNLELRDKIKYNRKTDIEQTSEICFLLSLFIILGCTIYFLIILVEIFGLSPILFNPYIIVVPLFWLILSYLVLKFSSEINKIIKIITSKDA